MSAALVAYVGGDVFDGMDLHADWALVLCGGRVTYLGPAAGLPDVDLVTDLAGDIVSPGFVDLQVNGGDGVMFNQNPSVDTLRRMAQAHGRLGATTILPTLITDAPDTTRAAILAAQEAVSQNVAGIGGLHLEGPHLSVARKGAHDAKLIRPMQDAELSELLAAVHHLPVLKVTVAPENVTPEQVTTLSEAGILVSLGHTDADFETCQTYMRAGARCATHLFNAMSQMGNRAPGVVGAVLASGGLSAGLIADGIHVHPAVMRTAWLAKQGPGRLFLVSDAMACAGSDITSFELGGRAIHRQDGRLTLSDGTLAGADLDLVTALRVLTSQVGVPVAQALRAATSVPAHLAGMADGIGAFHVGTQARAIRISADFRQVRVL